MAAVKLRRIEKIYSNSFKAVHGIDLTVNDGEFMVLVGPSGCAKSTTLRMIAGLESITAGVVRIGDRVVNNLPPRDRGIAMVFQNYALYPHMKVRKNLSFGLRVARRPKAEIDAAVDTVAAILEIEQLLDRLPKQLSGGQAQRVAVGRALIKKPDVFLFDEPLSNLDAKLRASMRVRIMDLHRRLKSDGVSSTAIYVTHDQTEAMTMGDRICVMKDGRIMQCDTPSGLFRSPANLFVAGFIGTPEMNLRPAMLFADGAATKLRLGEAVLTLPPNKVARPAGEVEVVLGARPHAVGVAAADAPDTLPARLRHVEYMGHEVILHAELYGRDTVAAISAEDWDSLPKGLDRIGLRLHLDRAHIFDPGSGVNLALN